MAEVLSRLAGGSSTGAVTWTPGSAGGALLRKFVLGVAGGTTRTLQVDWNAATPVIFTNANTARGQITYGIGSETPALRWGWNGYLFVPFGETLRLQAPSGGTNHYHLVGIDNPSQTYSLAKAAQNSTGTKTLLTASGTVAVLGIWATTSSSVTTWTISANSVNVFEAAAAGTFYIPGPFVLNNGETLTTAMTVGAGSPAYSTSVTYITLP